MSSGKPTEIVILGAGFGGLYAALALDRELPSLAGVRVTLVNRDNSFLFTPLLHEVAAGNIGVTNIVSSVRPLLRHVHLLAGEVTKIDLSRQAVEISHGAPHQHTVRFDHLLIALGGVTEFYDIPGLAQHALTMRTLGDAIYLRSRLINNLEQAEFTCCEDEEYLTYIVSGAGFVGVQTAAAIHDALCVAIKEYRNLDSSQVRVVIIDWRDEFLPGLSPSLKDYARRRLAKREIEILSSVSIKEFDGRRVTLTDGSYIATNTVIWTSGHSANPLLSTLACPKREGRLIADAYLQVEDHPGLWAVGDSVSIIDPETGLPYTPIPQHSLREGRLAAENIIAEITGERKRAFRVVTIPQTAQIGRRNAVANLFGFNASGFLPWLVWRTTNWNQIPGLQKKVRVGIDWALNLLFAPEIVEDPYFA